MKGTGFSPYITETKHWALATEGSVFGRETCPRGLKAAWLSNYMYGLKSLRENWVFYQGTASVVP
jgi:hypothetical protein